MLITFYGCMVTELLKPVADIGSLFKKALPKADARI